VYEKDHPDTRITFNNIEPVVPTNNPINSFKGDGISCRYLACLPKGDRRHDTKLPTAMAIQLVQRSMLGMKHVNSTAPTSICPRTRSRQLKNTVLRSRATSDTGGG